MVMIGHASISENNSTDGQKGDQTLKEVCTRDYYLKSWSCLLRPKDPNKAEIMAQSCEKGCANDAIGYSQSTRNTLRQEAIKVNFDLSKVGLCNCDCSSFISVCAESAGIAIPYNGSNAPTTKTMRNAFMSTGEFDLLLDSIYLTSPNFLKRGDILVAEGSHVVMVLSNGSLADKTVNSTLAVDLSVSQGNVDFVKLKSSGIKRIILRSTTKNLQPDIKFNEYLSGCRNNGFNVEVYKYSYALNTTDVVAEANSTIKLLQSCNLKTRIWLDLEDKSQTSLGKGGILAIATAFLQTCQNAGYDVGIYCNLDWYKNYIHDDLKNKYNFWIARYGKNTGVIDNTYKPNVGEIGWQYASKGSVIGINGDVDLSVFYDTYKAVEEQIGASTCVTEGIKINNTVNASSLNVRSHPAIIAPIISKLNRNEKVSIYGYFSNWYSIDMGLSEWVSADYILTSTGKVTANKLNYRQDAGTNANILGQYLNGEIVKILNKKKASDGKIWYLCLGSNERFGWASSEYIK